MEVQNYSTWGHLSRTALSGWGCPTPRGCLSCRVSTAAAASPWDQDEAVWGLLHPEPQTPFQPTATGTQGLWVAPGARAEPVPPASHPVTHLWGSCS